MFNRTVVEKSAELGIGNILILKGGENLCYFRTIWYNSFILICYTMYFVYVY